MANSRKSTNKMLVRRITGAVIGLWLLLAGCLRQPAPVSALPPAYSPASPAQLTASPIVQLTESAHDQAIALLPGAQIPLTAFARIPHYSLTVQISNNTYQGHARILYTNNTNVALAQVFLRLLPNGHQSFGDGSLRVSNVTVDSTPAKIILSNNNSTLEIDLSRPLDVHQTIMIEMDFQGVVPVDFGNQADSTGSGNYGIFNLTEGVMTLTGWYPLLAVYDSTGWRLDPVSWMGDSTFSETAFYTVDVSAPKDFLVVTTGTEVSTLSASSGTLHHVVSGPARDFCMVIADPRYGMQRSSRVVYGTTVNAYYHPKHKSAGLQALEVAAQSLETYNDRIGAYPFSEYDVVEVPLNHASGVEYPGLVLIGSALYDAPEKPDFAVTIAHETAHQWWYSLVGSDPFQHPWLDEALTSYTSSLYYEFSQSLSANRGLINYWQERYGQSTAKGEDDRITESLTHFQNRGDPRFYSTIVYVKGALFFNALRQHIGDAAFFTALQNYFQAHQYQIADPQDLLITFEEAAGRSLADFYQRWLYSTTRP